MLSKKFRYGFTFILLTIVFTILGYITLDPDFGWHLRMGQLILTSGIPQTDPFSYTMPNFPFIDHEWLTNVILFKFYTIIGKVGLSFIFAVLAVASLVIVTFKKPFPFTFIPILLAATTLLSYTGIRPQIETLFLFALLIKILTDRPLLEKLRIFTPLLFLLWVNLHGGFAIGIVTLLLFNIVLILEKRRISFANLAIFALSILATFLNPYKTRIWSEVWMQISDHDLRWSILEWYPMIFRVDFAFLSLLAISLFFILRYRKHFSLFEKLMYFGLLFAGLSSQRHIPFWLIAAIPIVFKSFKLAKWEFSKNILQRARFKKVYKIIAFSVILLCISQSIWTFVKLNYLTEDNFYPKQAIKFLKTLPKEKEIFSYYGWGGYLIWNLPQRRVFIDGRMPSWRWESPDGKNSSWAFKEYINAERGQSQAEIIFKKYNVGFILWPKEPTKVKMNIIEKFMSKYPKKADDKDFIARLKAAGWTQIYEDKISFVYQNR